MKIVLLSLLYLVTVSALAEENNNCKSNYYEVNGKRTCLLLVGVDGGVVIQKPIIEKPVEQNLASDEEYDDLQVVDPSVSDPGPDPR